MTKIYSTDGLHDSDGISGCEDLRGDGHRRGGGRGIPSGGNRPAQTRCNSPVAPHSDRQMRQGKEVNRCIPFYYILFVASKYSLLCLQIFRYFEDILKHILVLHFWIERMRSSYSSFYRDEFYQGSNVKNTILDSAFKLRIRMLLHMDQCGLA